MAYTIIIQRFNMFKGVQPSTFRVRATTELNESSDQRYFQLEGVSSETIAWLYALL